MNERNKHAMATMLDNLTASAVIAGVVFRENIEFPTKELALLIFAVVFLLTASFCLRGDWYEFDLAEIDLVLVVIVPIIRNGSICNLQR